MLLATPGQTATYNVCHAQASVAINSNGTGSSNSSSISSNHTKTLNSTHKLGRVTYNKFLESSQKNTIVVSSTSAATSTTTTSTQAAVLMKTIAVRGGFQSATQSVPANNVKSSTTIANNDKVANCVKRTTFATTNANNNSNTSKGIKPTSSGFSSNGSTANAKTGSVATTTSSSSSSTKIVISASFLKTYTVPPTDLHRHSEARLRSYSIDSLYDEMCHFKPIRSVPTTPWKCGSKSRGATIKAPKACLAQKTSDCDVASNTTRARKDLKRESSKAKAKIKPKLSANLFPHIKPHPSAFVRLLLPMCSYTIPSSTQRICKRLQSFKPTEPTKKKNEIEFGKNVKNTKKQIKSKGAKKQRSKIEIKPEPIRNATVNSKASNTKKRKTQTQTKKCESTTLKKVKTHVVDRKTPPLTRRRIRMDENCKLYGPLT